MSKEIRCLACGRLLGKVVHLTGDATVSIAIKCKCKTMNVKTIKIIKNAVQSADNTL